ncbi:MAG: hypothetical protein ACRDZP_02420, partial [Acidimicrobiales bacterium]
TGNKHQGVPAHGSSQVPKSSVLMPRAQPDQSGAIASSWVASQGAFYRAGQLGNPEYAPLLKTIAPGSPVLSHTIGWLTALETAGVVAPSKYRIGNVHVRSISGSTAVLTGCTFDTGSIVRATRSPAPASLGGGASYTASVAILHRIGGSWLVWSDASSTVMSPTSEGPCHGF